ncbi:hypothetical protein METBISCDRAFT_25178 [Metschnikowia bicuspidata]|uniref:ribonuclease Z n=1 Tax=Metschnikowia bicuspidata TaxID=27322 RepID=A0A4P9ZK92_9ASCO|nr:hypothetical protein METBISCDRAFT_25178 [Metschnikowia bicuspidata]
MFYVTTVCHRTSDSRHPLLVLTNRDGNRFFFGKVPEGSQRALNENGFRMSKVKSIFLTGTLTLWSEIGGIPGLFLTISDAMSRGLDVFVASDAVLKYIVATWRYFVHRRDCPINVIATSNKAVVADASCAFFPVHISPQLVPGETTQPSENVASRALAQVEKLMSLMFPTSLTAEENSSSRKTVDSSRKLVDSNYAGMQTHTHLPPLENLLGSAPQSSLNYIIRFLPTRGKFNAVRAKELGIAPGKDYKRLTTGELVVNSNGETVHPHQVMGESKTFRKIAVIDIPDERYLENTITSPEWFKQNEERGLELYGLVYHFLGADVDCQLDAYARFIEKFPSDCIHVVDHHSFAEDALVFKTSGIHLLKLKAIMNNNYNLPHTAKLPLACPSPFVKLHALQSFKIDISGIAPDDSAVQNDDWRLLFDKHVKTVLPDAQFSADLVPLTPVQNARSLKEHVQIVTLGTGSAIPAIYRNVLSNLVRVPYVDSSGEIKFRAILLDGGENTPGQLLRTYGHENQKQLRQIFYELCLVFLSHLHADHNLGLVSLITAWLDHNAQNDRKLYLVVPYQYEDFLREWYQLENRGRVADFGRICFIRCGQLSRVQGSEVNTMDAETFERQFDSGELGKGLPKVLVQPLSNAVWSQMKNDTNLVDIETCNAIHCTWAYSVSMKFQLSKQETFKISFSGDTRPNSWFVDIGTNSDVLIHEASLDDVNIEEAIEKRHTTVAEAVRVSQLMRCRKLVLTHFSTRFSEESNFIMSAEEYAALSLQLNEYLGTSRQNIFTHPADDAPLFDELDICYAYDMMSVRYNEIGEQKQHFKAIRALSLAQDSKEQMRKDEKKVRLQLKLFEKRDAKRQQRLGVGQ